MKLVQDIRQAAKKYRSVVAILGCGGGKSIIQAEIARNATDKGNTVLFLVHRKELCRQIEQTFTAWGVNMELCTVGMVQTVSRRLEDIPTPALIITDEAHHSTAATYRRIYDHFPEAWRLGFTATPIRLNRGGLGEVYEHMVESVSTKWLIDNSYLAPYKYYSVPLADTSSLHTRAGEFIADEVKAIMERKAVYSGAVEQYRKLAAGMKTMVYCSSVESSESIAKEFNAAGITAISLDGATELKKREKAVEDFRQGEIQVLTNCMLFSEGYDDKDIECVMLLRPTQSLSLYLQQAMRAMRYKSGKIAYIIDCVGACYLHGLPDDDRTWSLLPKERQETVVKIRECTNCMAVYSPNQATCPFCGYEAKVEIRKNNKKAVKIDLIEVKRQNDIRNTKLKDTEFTTWEEVREYQQLRKLKFAFCFHYCIEHGIPIPPKYKYSMRYIKR